MLIDSAMILVALLTLTLGLIQYGLIYNAVLALNNLSREGARFAAVRAMTAKAAGGNNDATALKALQKQVVNHLRERAAGTSIDPRLLTHDDDALLPGLSKASVQVTAPSLASNVPLRVTISYNMKANKGFVPTLLPLPASLALYEAQAANLIE